MASRVMSSWVGPRPPHTITASARARASRDGVDDALVVVAHLGLAQVLDAVQGQLLADPRGVRVDDLAEQQLGADGDDLAAHRPTISAAGCPAVVAQAAARAVHVLARR